MQEKKLVLLFIKVQNDELDWNIDYQHILVEWLQF